MRVNGTGTNHEHRRRGETRVQEGVKDDQPLVFLRMPKGIRQQDRAAEVVTNQRCSFNGEGFEKERKKAGVVQIE